MLFSTWLKKFKCYDESDLNMIDANVAIELENKYIKEFYDYCEKINANMCLNDLDRYYLL